MSNETTTAAAVAPTAEEIAIAEAAKVAKRKATMEARKAKAAELRPQAERLVMAQFGLNEIDDAKREMLDPIIEIQSYKLAAAALAPAGAKVRKPRGTGKTAASKLDIIKAAFSRVFGAAKKYKLTDEAIQEAINHGAANPIEQKRVKKEKPATVATPSAEALVSVV